MVVYDYSKLRGRIVEKFGTITAFAEFLGERISEISAKLNCNRDITKSEIMRWGNVLEIPRDEWADYFFTLKV